MNILFIGFLFTDEDEAQQVVRKGRGPTRSAANDVQRSLIRGLDKHNGKPVSILHSTPVGLYPWYYSEAVIRPRKWSHAPGPEDKNVGFINLLLLKHLTRCVNLSVCSARWAFEPSAEGRVIVVHSVHSPFLIAAVMAKLIDPKVRICLISPDLPQDMSFKEQQSILYKALKAFDRAIIRYLLRMVHGFILIVARIASALNVGHRPWIVMEALADPREFHLVEADDRSLTGSTIVLYAGNSSKQYGILDLLEAFELIDDGDCELWVYGSGDEEEAVRRAQLKDPRIHWLGQVDRGEVLALNTGATVLVNPGTPHGQYTWYSFPSKTLEYMISGVPVPMYTLPGIPPEFDPWIQWIEEDGSQAMARRIGEICNLSEECRRSLGERARRFALENKDYLTQSRRVFNLLQQITTSSSERGGS